jgi:hypothetical protein
MLNQEIPVFPYKTDLENNGLIEAEFLLIHPVRIEQIL